MRTLSARQLTLARAVADALFARDDGGPPAPRLDFAVAELRALVARAGWQTWLAFFGALWVVRLAPLLLGHGSGGFASLSREARIEVLSRLEHGRLGLVVVLLKTTLTMVYLEHPEALAETGYDAIGGDGPAHAPGASPLAPLPGAERRA